MVLFVDTALTLPRWIREEYFKWIPVLPRYLYHRYTHTIHICGLSQHLPLVKDLLAQLKQLQHHKMVRIYIIMLNYYSILNA